MRRSSFRVHTLISGRSAQIHCGKMKLKSKRAEENTHYFIRDQIKENKKKKKWTGVISWCADVLAGRDDHFYSMNIYIKFCHSTLYIYR